jgi:CheY-like chemotaxis protein/HD-like signal output (HDOD) protein
MTTHVMANPPEAQGQAGPPGRRQTPWRRPIPLLLADDNQMTRSSLAYILGRAGFAVEGARDGLEAVALAQSGRFRAILMDVHMPGLDGVAAVAMIRRFPALRDTPIVMVSSQASPETVRACRQVGAIDFVIKQRFSPAVLIAKLQKILSSGGEGPTAGARGGCGAGMAGGNGVGADGAEGIECEAVALTAEAWRQKVAFIGGLDAHAAAAAVEVVDLPLLVPSLIPEVAQLNLEAGADPARLVHLIEQDAALVIALLRASAGQGAGAREVPSALRVLGSSRVVGVLTDAAAGYHAPMDDSAAAWLRRGWRHALAVSLVAGELAEAAGVQPDLARAAGLLHEVGRSLILASPLGPRAIACYELAANLPFTAAMAEQMLLGITSDRVGALYYQRQGLAPYLTAICTGHDKDRQQGTHLGAPEAALRTVVAAADQIATAAGFASLKNDELWPLPAQLTDGSVTALRVMAALDKAENIALFRLGPTAPHGRSLSGLTVAFLSPVTGGLNSYQIALGAAGARLVDGRQLSDLAGRPAPDLVVLDAMAQPGAEARAMLKRVVQAADLELVPKLLLVRRSDDPREIVARSGPGLSVLSSPIRLGTLLRTTRRLAEQ